MPKQKTFTTRVSGLIRPVHVVLDEEGKELGRIQVSRNRLGMIVKGVWTPAKGEVLEFRRQPGLLRAQFACWTEAREWLGATIRPGFMRRTIEMWTGGKSMRLVPRVEPGRGWRVVGAKSGVVAQVTYPWFGRNARLETFRKIDMELLLFAYFIGGLATWESAAIPLIRRPGAPDRAPGRGVSGHTPPEHSSGRAGRRRRKLRPTLTRPRGIVRSLSPGPSVPAPSALASGALRHLALPPEAPRSRDPPKP